MTINTLPHSHSTQIPTAAGRWHSRGYLPHFETSARLQMITYRLRDSLPREAVARIRHQYPAGEGDIRFRRSIETYMDSGFGACLLKDPRVASVVREVWLNRHMHEYLLHAWVIMPNHVHVLIDVAPSTRLCTILEAWKSVSARRINAVLARSGQLWQKESWDRYIRNAVHYERAVSYIYENPVKAGLVERSEDWRWSSWGEGMLA